MSSVAEHVPTALRFHAFSLQYLSYQPSSATPAVYRHILRSNFSRPRLQSCAFKWLRDMPYVGVSTSGIRSIHVQPAASTPTPCTRKRSSWATYAQCTPITQRESAQCLEKASFLILVTTVVEAPQLGTTTLRIAANTTCVPTKNTTGSSQGTQLEGPTSPSHHVVSKSRFRSTRAQVFTLHKASGSATPPRQELGVRAKHRHPQTLSATYAVIFCKYIYLDNVLPKSGSLHHRKFE